MPGEPLQFRHIGGYPFPVCRQHALNCRRLAKEATTTQSKQTFQNLAQSWTRLAAELEQAQALLNFLNGMEFKNAPASSDKAEQYEEAP